MYLTNCIIQGSKNKIKSINTNINLDYKFTSWLSASAVLSYNSSASESECGMMNVRIKLLLIENCPMVLTGNN